MKRVPITIAWLALAFSSTVAVAQDTSARTVQYHSADIVPIRAKVKYTTLIEVPPTEKIMEAATGDKDFWIVDVVGNFCFVHPAKQGISSNLNLITDKGNIYSFTLQDISATADSPDLKVIVEPADHSSIVAANGPAQFVPAAQVAATELQTIGTIKANQSAREADITALENATNTTDSSQETQMAVLQRINRALLLQLRTMQDTNQINANAALQQMLFQKQQQDAMKAVFRDSSGYESYYNANIAPTSSGAANLLTQTY